MGAVIRGTRWRSWLMHCATSRKVEGSISHNVIGSFHWHNPSGRTMALGSTQPLREMSTRNISWGVKAVGAYGWQPYHLHVPIVLKSGSLNLLEPSGPIQGCNGIALPLLCNYSLCSNIYSSLIQMGPVLVWCVLSGAWSKTPRFYFFS